ncbi:MAG: hypothetical protein RIF33_25100 [Cyclobacteriaceae bacterium]
MKYLILCIGLLLTVTAYGQGDFAITTNGLEPKFCTSSIDHLASSELYEKTLTWIEENQEEYKLSIDEKIEGEMIELTSIKWNAVNLSDKYFIAHYHIRLNFEEDQYQFKPTAIQLKLNSKYDMGLEDFDLTGGEMYFKKGKVIKKYKAYLDDITALLNELNLQLNAYLKSN